MKQCPKCNAENPLEARFCRKCGSDLNVGSSADGSSDVRPFHIRHPELNLLPASDSEFEKLFFWFNKPEYVENPNEAENSEYLYIVRNGKIGILYWHYEKHWYGDTNDYNRIIPCKYDKIVKLDGMFECHINEKVDYIDLKGNLLK